MSITSATFDSPLMFIQTSVRGFKIVALDGARRSYRPANRFVYLPDAPRARSLRKSLSWGKWEARLLGFPRGVLVSIELSKSCNEKERRDSGAEFFRANHTNFSQIETLALAFARVSNDEQHDVTLATVVARLSKPRWRRRRHGLPRARPVSWKPPLAQTSSPPTACTRSSVAG